MNLVTHEYMIKFSEKECKDIIDLSNSLEENHSSIIFKNQKEVNYYFYTIVRNDSSQWIFDRFKSYLDEFYPNNKVNEYPQLYLHRYPAGCRFEKHNDSTSYPDQLVNIGACLNDSYTGGEFIFYSPDEVLPKVAGTIYHMDSYREHEVLEILEGERWSLIGFLKQKDIGKVNTNLI